MANRDRKPKLARATNSKHKPKRKKTTRPPRSNSPPSSLPARLPQTIPFSPSHRILLLGEGDFSFALSLVRTHACTSIAATTLETRSSLESKHPQAAAHVSALESAGQKVLYSVDATKLGRGPSGGGGAVRKTRWDRIVFNFPHVGGRTKDVNRQVRANQELLVGFLGAAKPLLADPDGQVVLTVFEGEPYELWGVRNLARHAGFVVERSMRFDATAYPGYRHARTLGNLRGETGWKGEERSARTFLLALPGAVGGEGMQGGKKRKRRDDSDDEDEDNDEDSD